MKHLNIYYCYKNMSESKKKYDEDNCEENKKDYNYKTILFVVNIAIMIGALAFVISQYKKIPPVMMILFILAILIFGVAGALITLVIIFVMKYSLNVDDKTTTDAVTDGDGDDNTDLDKKVDKQAFNNLLSAFNKLH